MGIRPPDVVPSDTPLITGYYYRVPNCTLTTSATLGVGSLRVSRKFVPHTVTATRIGAEVTSAGDVGSKLRLGIYADNGGVPGALVLDAGTINGDSATVQEITISQVLSRGWYWFGGAVQVVTVTQPTVRTISNILESTVTPTTAAPSSSTNNAALLTGVTGALPTPFTSYSSAGSAPSVFVKV